MIYLIIFLSGTVAWVISTAAAGGAAILLIPVIGFLLGAQLVPPIISNCIDHCKPFSSIFLLPVY
jgi:uncharacterized membrane protein YfcA